MSDQHRLPGCSDESGLYEIRIKGHLDEWWADRFGNVVITLEDNGNTLLTCRVIDQAALHGLLKKVRDLGMPLVSVSPVEPGPAGAPDGKSQTGVGDLFTQNQTLKGG